MMVTLTGTFTRLDGTPATGTVKVTPSRSPIMDPDGKIVISGPQTFPLERDGTLNVNMPASNDPDLGPAFTYTIEATLDHGTWKLKQVFLPHGSTTVDLSTVNTYDGPPVTTRTVTLPVDGADGQVLVWDGGGFSWMDTNIAEELSLAQTAATQAAQIRDESRTARDTAVAAAASATAPTDGMVAEKINDPSSLTATALSAAIDKSAGWLATNHGMKGAAGVDDGVAFQALLNAASTAGAAVVLDSGKRFEINQRIYVPTGTKLLMDGATLVNKMTASHGDALLFIEGTVKEVLIDGGTIDGDRYNKPQLGDWQHGIVVQGSAKNVVIRRVHSKDNNGDGVYINGTAEACPENITMDHVVCDNNVRQGLSITGVRGFNDFGSILSNTNGKPPAAGLDIEPNTPTSPMEGLKFHGTTITGNAGSGIDIAAWKLRTIRQGDVDFIGVTVTDNERGVRLVTGDSIRFFGGTINRNTSHGVWSSASEGICTDVAFTGTEITGNGGSGIKVDVGIIGFSLVNCDVRNNTTAGAGVGVDLNPPTERLMENVTLIGNHMGGLYQTHALRTNGNVKKVTRVGNTYDPVQTVLLSIADDPATRYVAERASGYSAVHPLAGDTALAFHVAGEDFPRALIRADGDLRLGDGTAAGDTRLYRDAPDSLRTNDLFTADLGVKSGAYVRSAAYTTANRPTAGSAGSGARIFDSTLGKPIWSTGSVWVDATGTTV